MARYSRRRGPAADFELTAVAQAIPGFDILRSFGRGTLQFLFSGVFLNAGIGVVTIVGGFLVDGGSLFPVGYSQVFAPGIRGVISFGSLQPIDPGSHLLQVFLIGDAAVGEVVLADRSEFYVVELPEWDRDTDLLTL